uniref:Ribbon-helix-helix protein, CopG family n=1 Tax=Ignisphaera aggregans TaxID=334771 RepID=A0A7C2VDN9_9CREN
MRSNDYNIIELDVPLSKVISIKIDTETLKETDIIYRKRGFRSRSELIREAIAFYIELLKRYDREEIRRIIHTVFDVEDLTKKR